uniref:tumor necrosis factor receptor superfamily member 10B-like isoform X2 n=1 Tax=Myxine glutinosa TaxID=7769 RepID=UPI00358E9515
MNYFMIAAVFLPLCAARPWNQEGRGTSKDHDLQNCRECPAGYFMRNTFETPGGCTCTICPPGTFMEYPNNKSSCRRCKDCSQGFEEQTPCNGTHDRVCRCMAGTFQDRDNEICHYCKTCDGQEGVKKCTDIEDTVCSSTPIDEANTDKPNTTASLPGNVVFFFCQALPNRLHMFVTFTVLYSICPFNAFNIYNGCEHAVFLKLQSTCGSSLTSLSILITFMIA